MSARNLYTAFFVGSLMFMNATLTHAEPRCQAVFNKTQTWAQHEIDADHLQHKDTLEVLARLEASRSIDHFISYEKAKELLTDLDLPLYGKILEEVSLNLKNVENINADSFAQALKEVLTARDYSETVIAPRLAALKAAGEKDWTSILGDLSLAEVQFMFYGKDPSNPAPDSLVGKYLSESGAAVRKVAFPKVLGGTELGPEKVVIAVSANSFPAFEKLILSSSHFMTVLGHAAVVHKGLFYSHGGTKTNVRVPSVNTPFPIVLFKTTEAQRLNRYMELAVTKYSNSWTTPLKQPWLMENYCAKGGFTCCTHWLGNVPIGDKLVSEYKLPPPDGTDRTPRIQQLQKYSNDPKWDDLRLVWKVPGHEQLADVIGQQSANLAGEMASPGWVIQTLIGPTKAERVPFVFVMTNDHKAELPALPVLNFERPW